MCLSLSIGLHLILTGLLFYNDLFPIFEDPMIGFEARNTELSNRINAWRILIESTASNGGLSIYPKLANNSNPMEQSIELNRTNKKLSNRKLNRKNSKKNKKWKQKLLNKEDNSVNNSDPFEGKNHQLNENYFCGKIVEDYAHFILETNDETNLLDLKSIKNLCKIDQYLLRMELPEWNNRHQYNLSSFIDQERSNFVDYCEVKNSNTCCPSWTIGNYILLLSNKTNCDDLIETDIDYFVDLLDSCSLFYAKRYLNEDCFSNGPEDSVCSSAPKKCYSYENLVFNVFHYMVDYKFLDLEEKILFQNEQLLLNQTIGPKLRPFLRSTSIYLPMAKSSKLMPYYELITKFRLIKKTKSEFNSIPIIHEQLKLNYENIRIVAADLGLKYTLFNRLVITDLILPLTAGLIILISLLIFTRSSLLTIMTLLTNITSLISAYFIYTFLFNITFFPFLNLLSLIILVGNYC